MTWDETAEFHRVGWRIQTQRRRRAMAFLRRLLAIHWPGEMLP